MKPLPSLMLLALLLPPWVSGPAGGSQAAGLVLRSRGDAACAAPGACGSSREDQKVKAGSESPWILAYVPLRSCHRVLTDKHGEFSPPAYHSDFPLNLWCNWTIWAGSRKHILVYVQGFSTQEGCHRNDDKILFQGVSSLVESSVVYACWHKETHVFATLARAVHVVLLKRSLPSSREAPFKGSYHIFQDQEGEASSKGDVASGTPAPELPKQGGIFEPENLTDVLGSATPPSPAALGQTVALGSATPPSPAALGQGTVLSSELMQQRGILPGASAVGSPTEIAPAEPAKTSVLETKGPCVLGSELPGVQRRCQAAEGRGAAEHFTPSAAQAGCGQRLSVSGGTTPGFACMHRLSSVLSAATLPGAWRATEQLWQPAEGPAGRQSALHPTPRLQAPAELRFAVQPTRTSRPPLAAPSQPLVPGGGGSEGSTDATTHRGPGTVSLEKDESHPQLSTDGTASGGSDSLAEGLVPSLSSPCGVAHGDHWHLLPPGCQSAVEALSMTQPGLGTSGLQPTQLLSASSAEGLRTAAEEKAVLRSTTPWHILLGHPHWHRQSSHSLQAASTDPSSVPRNAHSCPAAERALGVKSCHHQSARAAGPGLQSSPAAVPTLGTGAEPAGLLSCTEPVLTGFDPTDFSLPLAAEPVSSSISSPPAVLDLDTVGLRLRAGISLASPGGQEMISPSPPCHLPAASEAGTNQHPGCLGSGMQELLEEAGGQHGATFTLEDSQAGGPPIGPKPAVGFPQPEDHVSSGSGVAPASLHGTWGVRREELVVPVQHGITAARGRLTSDSVLGGPNVQKTTEAPQVGTGEQRNASARATPAESGPPVTQQGQTVWRSQEPQEPSADPQVNIQVPGGQQQEHAELGPPWAVQYSPIRSCHLVLRDVSGMFSLPPHADANTNIWCNWTVLAGPQQHVVIYIQGFQSSEDCAKNQDKIIFQGVLSRVETKVVYACHSRGTLVFATQAAALHVLLLAGRASLRSHYGHFRGHYYVFKDSALSNDAMAPREPVQEVSKEDRWRIAGAEGLLPMSRAWPGPWHAAAGRQIQLEPVSPTKEPQHLSDLMESAHPAANLSQLGLRECGHLQDETELDRSLEGGGTEGREAEDDMLAAVVPAQQDPGPEAELSASEPAKAELASALLTSCHSANVPSSEVPGSGVDVFATSSSLGQASASLSEVAAAAHGTQTLVLEEALLSRSTKAAPLSPSPGVTAGDGTSPGEGPEELFDLLSALALLENGTELQAQHHPGDVLFEVAAEITPKDWISGGRSKLQKDLLNSVKRHIQENLKLSASRVSEIKLKEVKRSNSANLLLSFWVQLKPEERNLPVLLQSQLEQLLGLWAGAEQLQLLSLLVEDVNECSAGVSLCGEEAECFNGLGTYLCRCKEGYEDHSPTKAGTSCVPVSRSGIVFLQHADMLVGAAIVAALAMLVAAGAMCRAGRQRRSRRRLPSPEEAPGRAAEEPAIELRDLGQCLRLDPFQLKLRARTPEWLWGARSPSAQAYQLYMEQSTPL